MEALAIKLAASIPAAVFLVTVVIAVRQVGMNSSHNINTKIINVFYGHGDYSLFWPFPTNNCICFLHRY